MKRADFLLAAALAALDQLVKHFVRAVPQGTLLFDLPPLFSIVHVSNTGAAFNILAERTALITLISILLLAALLALLRRMRPTRAGALALAVLIGGGIGNLIDRAFFGSVTDYIRLMFIDFPVFNLADIFITVSVVALILLLLVRRLEEKD